MTARVDVNVASYASRDLSVWCRFARQKLLRFGLCCGRIHSPKDHRDREFKFLNSNIMAPAKANPHLRRVSKRSNFLIEVAETAISSTHGDEDEYQ
jgi:hypothetical protein